MATTVSLDRAAESGLASGFGGDLIDASDQRYEEARKVYNAMIDRRPGADCALRRTSPTSIAAVNLRPRDERLLVSIRGGGTTPAASGSATTAW